MKKLHLQKLFKLSSLGLFMLVLLATHGCKKTSTYQDVTENINDPEVLAAQSWYNATYPATTATNGTVKSTGAGSQADLSQHIQPDWYHHAKYARYNKNVIEMPVDPANPALAKLKSRTKTIGDKYIKSEYLLLKGDDGYHAYLMTIIADSDYIKNDFSRLKRNSYNSREADFSGLVLYFTPKGKYVSGYRYKNGRLLPPANAAATANTTLALNGAEKNKVNDMMESCIDWYFQVYEFGVLAFEQYVYTECLMIRAAAHLLAAETAAPALYSLVANYK
ncbi:hypothetical protein ACFGVR_01020 [Mucilaginibacter sp. AW1-3]